ncbi:hypothetical protein [Spirosoma litoris]
MMDNFYERNKRYDEQLFARLKPLVEKPDSLENKFCQRLLSDSMDWDWEQVKSFLNEFIKSGFYRKDLYELTRYVQFNNELAEEREEYLAEIMGNLTGYCMFERIIRLNNEPQEPDEFREYFERIRWGWEPV